mgnify:CR=1 FL=1
MKLFLKGDRCYTDKCAIVKRNYAPGQHGQGRKKLSNYGLQLREKQKVKRIYGVLETQFRNLYERAEKMSGKTGENLLCLLEERLDNVVFRMGLANSKKVDIPSLIVKVGDVIAVKETSKSSAKFKALVEANKVAPNWLDVNLEEMSAKVVALPTREDIDIEIAEHLIIELYSK